MMKPRFSEKISDRKLIETSKQSSIGKILSGQVSEGEPLPLGNSNL
ncbi:MAG: hypothetical protein RM347_033975 [Nostoc sp. ChiQUE02]|nr:hypothetical protein [Nostoc sp. ChiQUE02]MDZ8229632.1 hypothetical protein [Nostoc sp. ChiQUE02]